MRLSSPIAICGLLLAFPFSGMASAALRFPRDVVDRSPALVVIQFGINDSTVDAWKKPPVRESRVPIEEYRLNRLGFESALCEKNIGVILMTPNPLIDADRVHRDVVKKSSAALLLDGMHPSQTGHELVAGLLADAVVRDSLLSSENQSFAP